jgi:hypothetical protein
MSSRRPRTLLLLSALGCIAACSSGQLSPGDAAAAGGTTSSGGSAAASGGTAGSGGAASGGQASTTGGQANNANGGQPSGGSGGTPSSGGAPGSGGAAANIDPAFDTTIDSSTLTFQWANATNYTSYPDPGSDECVIYNGCEWAGYFAAVDGQQTEAWVEAHNIVAFFSAGDDNAGFETYQQKRLRLRKGGEEIDVYVYDTCGDSDCGGCCTDNATQNGYSTLIDLESFTYARFGQGDGPIEWACLDCD